MGVVSADQITIVDITDAYSVILTSEAFTFVGDTTGTPVGQSCTTEIVAFCGNNQCNAVNVNLSDIICPTGMSATVENSGTAKVKVTFKTTAVIKEACEATIPVVVDGITVNKKFSFAVALRGQTGATGAAAISMTTTASNGMMFKNSSGTTVLTAHVFVGGVEQEITEDGVCDSYGVVKWYKAGSTTPIAVGKSYTVTADDVDNTLVITAQLED